MSKCKCEECAFNATWVFMKGCPLLLAEACDGVKKFKPKKQVKVGVK